MSWPHIHCVAKVGLEILSFLSLAPKSWDYRHAQPCQVKRDFSGMPVCVHACACMHACVCTYACACMCVCVCTCTRVHACVHVCTCVQVWPHPSSGSTFRGQNMSTAGQCPPLLFSSSGDLLSLPTMLGLQAWAPMPNLLCKC